MKKSIAALCLPLLLSACSLFQDEPVRVFYGQVTAVQPRQVMVFQPNLAGAAAGGVAGGVLGHQFGKGNGKTALTVLGVVGGALVGSQVHKTESLQDVTDLTIRLPDGHPIVITTSPQGFHVGQHVRIVQKGRQATVEAIADGPP